MAGLKGTSGFTATMLCLYSFVPRYCKAYSISFKKVGSKYKQIQYLVISERDKKKILELIFQK